MGAVINEVNLAITPIAHRLYQDFPIERRSHQRFPLQFNVRYRQISRRNPISGTGRTVNISSNGLLVSTNGEAPTKSRVEIMVEWPSLLNGKVPLQMVIEGRVVRSNGSGFAVAILHHEFRTMKRPCPSAPLAKTAIA